MVSSLAQFTTSEKMHQLAQQQVLLSYRNVRGPGQRRPTWNAAELGLLVRDFGLEDTEILRQGNNFEATWRRGTSQSRLDRFYLNGHVKTTITDIKVASFPHDASYVSDHKPVILCLIVDGNRLAKKKPYMTR